MYLVKQENYSIQTIILCLLKLGIAMLIHNKDDIEFVTEFPCLLGHPVGKIKITNIKY